MNSKPTDRTVRRAVAPTMADATPRRTTWSGGWPARSYSWPLHGARSEKLLEQEHDRQQAIRERMVGGAAFTLLAAVGALATGMFDSLAARIWCVAMLVFAAVVWIVSVHRENELWDRRERQAADQPGRRRHRVLAWERPGALYVVLFPVLFVAIDLVLGSPLVPLLREVPTLPLLAAVGVAPFLVRIGMLLAAGDLELVFEPDNPEPGQRVDVRLSIERSAFAVRRVEAVIVCVRRVTTRTDMQDTLLAEVRTAWREGAGVPSSDEPIALQLHVPTDAPSTIRSWEDSINWLLLVRVWCGPGSYTERFALPVGAATDDTGKRGAIDTRAFD